MEGTCDMVGIYINGNGKHQYVANKLIKSADKLNLSKTCRETWERKIRRYRNFYIKGESTKQLQRAALDRYENIGTIEMAVSTYLEEDMDMFLEKVQRILNTRKIH